MKLAYACMEVMTKLQHTANDPRLLDGWAFITLLCIQEAAMGNGNTNAGRLYQRFCAGFPEIKSPVGDRSIMQFVLFRSSKNMVNNMLWISWSS